MELFSDNGHLTSEGLQAIVDGTLNELESLEASEHLSFCDGCLTRYLTLLEGGELLQPTEPLREPVLRRIRQKAKRVLFSRYATVAAAAAIAVGIWTSGIYSGLGTPDTQGVAATDESPAQQSETASTEVKPSLNTRIGNAMDSVGTGINSFFSGLFGGAQPAPEETNAESPSIFERWFGDDAPAESHPDESTPG